MNLEDKIQNAVISLLEEEDFISDNNIPVREWFNTEEEITGRQVIVHANPATPSLYDERGEAREWNIQIDIMSYVHNPESLTVEESTLYRFLLGWTNALSILTLTTASELNITGKNSVDSGEQYDERFRGKIASFEIFCSEQTT